MRTTRIALLLLTLPALARADLVINLDFTAFESSAPGNISTILNGASLADAENVMRAAASYWEAAFAGSNSSASFATAGRITQNIAVSWSALDATTLAVGGTNWNPSGGALSGGYLHWDNDGSSKFYVDTTPWNTTEWTASSNRSATLGGVLINVERTYFGANTASVVFNNTDLLTVALHEMGHALGYLGGYTGYVAATGGGAGPLTISSGPFAGATLSQGNDHLTETLTQPADYPASGYFIPGTYYPELMGPSIVKGTRKVASEADIAGLAEILGFDAGTVNYNPAVAAVPEPGYGLAGAGVAGVLIAIRRRRKTLR